MSTLHLESGLNVIWGGTNLRTFECNIQKYKIYLANVEIADIFSRRVKEIQGCILEGDFSEPRLGWIRGWED